CGLRPWLRRRLLLLLWPQRLLLGHPRRRLGLWCGTGFGRLLLRSVTILLSSRVRRTVRTVGAPSRCLNTVDDRLGGRVRYAGWLATDGFVVTFGRPASTSAPLG